jgi:hypothetical protein
MSMIMTKIRNYVKLATVLGGAVILGACGGSVVLEPEDTGQGGGTTSSSSSTVTSSQASTGSGPTNCSDTTCSGLGTNDCSCFRTCGFAKLEATCALNEDKTLVCVCSYDDSFSGTCFEKTPNVCDIDKGCCAKYFQGI